MNSPSKTRIQDSRIDTGILSWDEPDSTLSFTENKSAKPKGKFNKAYTFNFFFILYILCTSADFSRTYFINYSYQYHVLVCVLFVNGYVVVP